MREKGGCEGPGSPTRSTARASGKPVTAPRGSLARRSSGTASRNSRTHGICSPTARSTIRSTDNTSSQAINRVELHAMGGRQPRPARSDAAAGRRSARRGGASRSRNPTGWSVPDGAAAVAGEKPWPGDLLPLAPDVLSFLLECGAACVEMTQALADTARGGSLADAEPRTPQPSRRAVFGRDAECAEAGGIAVTGLPGQAASASG